MTERIKDFRFEGKQYRLVGDYFTADDPPSAGSLRGTYTDEEVDTVLQWCEYYWQRCLELGFVTFGRLNADVYVYKVVFDRLHGSNANANNLRMTIGAGQIGSGEIERLQAIVIHELFHACQYASRSGILMGNAFTEGTADLATFLFEPTIRDTIGVPSMDVYLGNPGETMWDRPTPGRSHSSRSTPTLFWLYLFTQLGQRTDEPGPYTDALRDFINSVNTPDTAAWQGWNVPVAVAEFLQNGDSQLLMRSGDQRTLGLVSVNRSYGVHGASHWRLEIDERWGNGWRFRLDDKVVGTGDFIAAGSNQLVLQSSRPTHVGIVGFAPSDGSPRMPVEGVTYAVVSEGDRWGEGWLVRAGDQVVSVGRFREATRSSLLVKSTGPAYLGLLYMDESGAAQTGAVVPEGRTLGEGGWMLAHDDEIVGKGDFLGIGTEQFIIRRAGTAAMGIVGVDAERGFTTHAIVGFDGQDRFGTGWRLRENDQVLATANLSGSSRADILIQSSGPAYLGVVGLDGRGATETRLVISSGGALGSNWNWSTDDQLMGVGRFINNGRHQMAWLASNKRRIGIVGFEANSQAIAYEVLDDAHGKGLRGSDILPLAIGNFAGMDTDQLLAATETTIQLATLEEPYLPDDSGNRPGHGLWRTRYYSGRNNPLHSTLNYLDNFVRSKTGGRRTLESLWSDFIVCNVTRNLQGAPRELSYPLEIPVRSVTTEQFGRHRHVRGATVNRWSARYFQIPSADEAVKLQVRMAQPGTVRHLYYAAVVASESGQLKKVERAFGTTFSKELNVAIGDQVTLLVSATYASTQVDVTTTFVSIPVISSV